MKLKLQEPIQWYNKKTKRWYYDCYLFRKENEKIKKYSFVSRKSFDSEIECVNFIYDLQERLGKAIWS